MNLPISTTKSTTDCGNCGSQNVRFLHHVRLRGIQLRLCTSCVLRLHPSSFCPVCLHLYSATTSPIPQPSQRLTCSSCSSFTHAHCSPSTCTSTPTPTPYLCPPCRNPNFQFFDLDKTKQVSNFNGRAIIDKRLAEVLLCAARIAGSSMGKAEIVARAEAERRVREAALARKRAMEALEQVVLLVGKDKVRRMAESEKDEGSGNVGVKEKKTCNPIVSAIVDKAVKVENSCEHPPNLRNVGSMKNGVVEGRQNVGLGSQSNGNVNVNVKEKSENLGILKNGNVEAQHL